MKIKFLLLTLLLLFTRGCDFYSTSLWYFQPGGAAGETNPLSRFFGVGWNGLILANVLVVGLIVYAFYYYTFRYTPKTLHPTPTTLADYVSETYFGEKGKAWQVFYRTPKDKNILLAHLGYVMIRVAIVGSILATVHNLCQFYQVEAYAVFREIVRRPLFVIYGLIILSVAYYSMVLWRKEYKMNKETAFS